MHEAIRQAKIAYQMNEFPVGVVIVHAGQILSAAHNMVETSSNPLMHAEVRAINDALKTMAHKATAQGGPPASSDARLAQGAEAGAAVRGASRGTKYLNDCDIYVTLEPCLMCFKAISLVKMRRIYYGVSNSSEYSIENLNYKLLDFNFVPEIYGGISEDEISQLFQKHLSKMRK